MLANVPQSDSGQSIYSVYDPQVEFLELGVKVGNAATEWKVFGNDLNGHYGGLHGIGGLLGLHSSDASAVERIVDDAYGHQQGVLNTGSGALTWTTQSYGAYGAFGAELPTLESGSTLASTRGWRGYRTDPTGFIYMGARYYNATEGRFISPDPFGHAASMDLYSFANGDPINFVDPTGRQGARVYSDTVLQNKQDSREAAWGWAGNAANNTADAWQEIARTDSGITGARIYAGIYVSVLSGDIFDKQGATLSNSNILSVNGINTDAEGRIAIADSANLAFGVNNTNAVANDSHGPLGLGDIIQVIGEELGAITTPSIRAAQIAREVEGSINWIAHSQGASVSRGAFALLDSETKSRIDYQGFGGQTYIDAGMHGLNSGRNAVIGGDFVPNISLTNRPFMNNDSYEVLPSNGLNYIEAHKWGNPGGYNQYINSSTDPVGKNPCP